MHVVILARDQQLAAIVKDRFDRRRNGLTEIVRVTGPESVARALTASTPTALLLVGQDLDADSLDICLAVGGVAQTSRVPFVVALARATEAERIAVLDAGADDVVQPFDLDVIERRLRVACRLTSSHRSFLGRDLAVDSSEPTAIAMGRRVALTPLEAAVLRVLVHQRNGVVSRGELEQRVWGRTRSRTLDVHVARLRTKLGPIGSRIQTVRCVGYRYVEPS